MEMVTNVLQRKYNTYTFLNNINVKKTEMFTSYSYTICLNENTLLVAENVQKKNKIYHILTKLNI